MLSGSARTPNAHNATIEASVASRLAALRREAGLTLKVVGAKTGLSDAYLSRVERGQVAITLASLEKIAAVFAAPIRSFFEPANEPPRISICRAGRRCETGRSVPTGVFFRLFADDRRTQGMDPILIEVSSATRPGRSTTHLGEEFNYVLRGRCHFSFGCEQHTLEEGDCTYFDATVPHALRALQGKACQLLAVKLRHRV